MHELHLPGSGLTTVAGRWFDWKIFLFFGDPSHPPSDKNEEDSHQ